MNPNLLTKLRHLRLSGMAEALPARLAQAEGGSLSFLEFLELLVEDELLRRADRLFARRVKQATIPTIKELKDFDWGFNPKIPKTRIVELEPSLQLQAAAARVKAGYEPLCQAAHGLERGEQVVVQAEARVVSTSGEHLRIVQQPRGPGGERAAVNGHALIPVPDVFEAQRECSTVRTEIAGIVE